MNIKQRFRHRSGWICHDCGMHHGTPPPEPFIGTWHHGTCDWCKKEVEVTSSTDYRLWLKEEYEE